MKTLLILTAGLAVLLAVGPITPEPLLAGDTTYIAIDQADVTLPDASRGVEPSPFIIQRIASTMSYHAIIMTLNASNGSRKGGRLAVALPEGHEPVDALWAKHFSLSPGRGVGPSPFIVFRDFRLYTFPVTYAFDGAPSAGTPTFVPLSVDPGVYGFATCLAELPATEFADAKARLFIGTDAGFVIVIVCALPGVPSVEHTFVASVPPVPVIDMQPIPQSTYIAIAPLTAVRINGFRYNVPIGGVPNAATVFTIGDARPTSLTGFDTFGPHDLRLNGINDLVRLILADGTPELALGNIGPAATGNQYPPLTPDMAAAPIMSIATGSLLMLPVDESAVMYALDYAADTGMGSCSVDITRFSNESCEYFCGDPANDNTINVGDAVYLIGFLFRGGMGPEPTLEAGDANCDGEVNVGDAVHLINYVFKGGPEPCCP